MAKYNIRIQIHPIIQMCIRLFQFHLLLLIVGPVILAVSARNSHMVHRFSKVCVTTSLGYLNFTGFAPSKLVWSNAVRRWKCLCSAKVQNLLCVY